MYNCSVVAMHSFSLGGGRSYELQFYRLKRNYERNYTKQMHYSTMDLYLEPLEHDAQIECLFQCFLFVPQEDTAYHAWYLYYALSSTLKNKILWIYRYCI